MPNPQTIIVLEDDRTSAHLLSWFLIKKGYNALEIGEGRAAIELAIKRSPALLVADMMLPDMKGIDVVKAIRKIAPIKDLKVIFLTSLLTKDGKGGAEVSIEIDGERFPAVGKPFNPPVFGALVQRLIGLPPGSEEQLEWDPLQ